MSFTSFEHLPQPDPQNYTEMIHGESEYLDAFSVDAIRDIDSQKSRIHERDWDILFVFDACRWDAMQAAFPDYEVEGLYSEGESTSVWLPHTWTEDSYDDLTYVSGHPYTDPLVDGPPDRTDKDLPDMELLMGRHVQCTSKIPNGAWSKRLSTALPEEMVDIALDERPPMVVHLMQPHTPFIGSVMLHAHADIDHVDIKPSNLGRFYPFIEDGLVDIRLGRLAYFTNLITALDAVDSFIGEWRGRLLSSDYRQTELKVVFTADHGEVINEGRCSHGSRGTPQTMIVPWLEFELTEGFK